MTPENNSEFSDRQLKQIRQVFNEGITELVLPQFDNVFTRLDRLKKVQSEHTENFENHSVHFDRIENYQRAIMERLDQHDERIKNLEDR